MTQDKITGETNTSLSSDLPEQIKQKKTFNKTSLKNDLNRVKSWCVYVGFALLLALVILVIYIYFAGSTDEMRHKDLMNIINYLVDKGLPASFGAFFTLILMKRK
jgi:hypothetical protein